MSCDRRGQHLLTLQSDSHSTARFVHDRGELWHTRHNASPAICPVRHCTWRNNARCQCPGLQTQSCFSWQQTCQMLHHGTCTKQRSWFTNRNRKFKTCTAGFARHQCMLLVLVGGNLLEAHGHAWLDDSEHTHGHQVLLMHRHIPRLGRSVHQKQRVTLEIRRPTRIHLRAATYAPQERASPERPTPALQRAMGQSAPALPALALASLCPAAEV
jgi:hypothetical protein